MKVFLLLAFLFFFCDVPAQVVCNDLKNPACQCSWKAAQNILLNPSFEEFAHCPIPGGNFFSNSNIIKDWTFGVNALSDMFYYHPLTCKEDSAAIMYALPVQLPLPDGKAFVLISQDGSLTVSKPESAVRKAYIAQCLQTPLIKGNKYTFTFFAGRFKDRNNNTFVPHPIQVGIFGHADCKAVPFGSRGGTGNGCPSNHPGWVLLGSASVYSNGTWVQAKIEFIAPADISVIEVGPDCSLIPVGVEFLTNPYVDSHIFFLDNLQLAETKDFNFKYISVQSGTPCSGNYMLKAPSEPGAIYQWYRDSIAIPGAVNDIYAVPDSVNNANYNVRITLNGNCQVTEPYAIRRSLVYSLQLPADTFLCKNDTLVLAKARPGIKYSWNGITDSIVKIHAPGTFVITATDTLGCTKNFTTQVNFRECAACTVFVPSAFTPNGDGLNDVLRGNINCPVDEYQLQVFNRWGQKVFETRNANKGWDGMFKGKQATVGVYVYFVRFKNSGNEKSYKYKQGSFVLLR